jgi:hypothetical protein
LFHHHGHVTEAERERLLREGAALQGIVAGSEHSAADRRIWRVSVSVKFRDGQRAEFSEELDSLYQPAAGSPEARRLAEARGAAQLRHPDRVPKIQLPLFTGARVPVRYDPEDPRKIVLDLPALRKRALRDYIAREQEPKGQSPARQDPGTGPAWAVPARCPNCGAPVDQAQASRERDPGCQFCRQPLPVRPAR